MWLSRQGGLFKPMVFALLGAIGAVAGGLPGESIWWLYEPASSTASDTSTAGSIVSFPRALEEKIEQEGGEKGEIEFNKVALQSKCVWSRQHLEERRWC